MLTRRDVTVDKVLSNVSQKIANEGFVAENIMPTFRVGEESGKYYVYDKSNLRRDNASRAPGSGANETSFNMSLETYQTQDHALKDFIPDEIQDQAEQALDPLVDATENLTEKLMLDKEAELANTLSDTDILTQNVTLSGTDQWNDYEESNPIDDIRAAASEVHSNILKRPNTLLIGKEVFDALEDHPDIIERVKYSQLGVLTTELLARLFNVDNVIVGQAGENVAAEGQDSDIDYVWGKNAWLLYVNPEAGLKQITFGRTFRYQEREVIRWRDEDRKGTYVRVGNENYAQKVVAPEAGYFIQDAVA